MGGQHLVRNESNVTAGGTTLRLNSVYGLNLVIGLPLSCNILLGHPEPVQVAKLSRARRRNLAGLCALRVGVRGTEI